MEKESKALCGICKQQMPEGEEMFQYHGYSGKCTPPPNTPDPTNGEEKMREEFENHFGEAPDGNQRLWDEIEKWWLAQLKSSHLALLEQMIVENEGRKKDERNMAKGEYCLETVGEVLAWNGIIDLINTDLRTKIEELKKQP